MKIIKKYKIDIWGKKDTRPIQELLNEYTTYEFHAREVLNQPT